MLEGYMQRRKIKWGKETESALLFYIDRLIEKLSMTWHFSKLEIIAEGDSGQDGGIDKYSTHCHPQPQQNYN